MTTHTFKAFGFTLPQLDAILAILDLAESAVACQWRMTDSEESDILMINLDTEEGFNYYQTQLQNMPAYRVVAVAEESSKTDPQGWFLHKKSHAPPSLKELTLLLNEVAEVLAEANKIRYNVSDVNSVNHADNEPAAAQPVDDEMFDAPAPTDTMPEAVELPQVPVRPLAAQNYFFGNLIEAIQDKGCRIYKLNALPELYVSPTEKSYYFAGTDAELLSYCLGAPQLLSETQLTKAKLNKNVANHKLASQSLDSLLVYAVLKVSGGRLLEGHHPDRSVHLKRVPDSKNLPELAEYDLLAKQLHQQADTLFNLAERLSIPLAKVFDFYNVCLSLGYLELAGAKPAAAGDQKSGAFANFIKTIFSK